MRFDSVKKLRGEAFRRLTGVQRSTFEDMVGLLFAAKRRQKAAGGKPNTLSIEDQLLMMLEYWREYRTYFHIAQTHGISESAAYQRFVCIQTQEPLSTVDIKACRERTPKRTCPK